MKFARRARVRKLRRLLLYLALKLNGVRTVFFGLPDGWEFNMPDDETADTEASKADLPYHYVIACGVNARNKLLDVIRKSDEVGIQQKRQLLDLVQLAERVPGALKDRLDWDKEAKEMARWDKGLADFLKGQKA